MFCCGCSQVRRYMERGGVWGREGYSEGRGMGKGDGDANTVLSGRVVLVDLFFREVHPRGSFRIPRRGPVIFVAAPHANQVSCAFQSYSLMGMVTLILLIVRRPPYPHACGPYRSQTPHLLPRRRKVHASQIYRVVLSVRRCPPRGSGS